MNERLREISLSSANLHLIQGDITQVKTDAIVNPANSQLMHGGGLAGLLAKKAGPILQQESNAWVKEHGPVKHASPAYTSAGALPFQYIIHAVGPVWGSGHEKEKLRDAVQGALRISNDLDVLSIALPAISTGIFGFPIDLAAKVILLSITEYLENTPESGLKEIQMVLFDDQSASIFSEVWDQIMP
jgi:O-acetyl-ADP-ribose deacetylase (regulator of RNase III)